MPGYEEGVTLRDLRVGKADCTIYTYVSIYSIFSEEERICFGHGLDMSARMYISNIYQTTDYRTVLESLLRPNCLVDT